MTAAVPVPPLSGKLLGVQETADRLGVHANTVRNWVRAGRLRAARPLPGLKFDPAEVERVLRSMAGRDLASIQRGNATVGILVVVRLPDMMTPEDAVNEVRRGIEFGEPRVGLHFVVPDAREQEELWLSGCRSRCGCTARRTGPGTR
jgi:excisionase family DNA binding protein